MAETPKQRLEQVANEVRAWPTYLRTTASTSSHRLASSGSFVSRSESSSAPRSSRNDQGRGSEKPA